MNKCSKTILGLISFFVLFGIKTNAQETKVYSGPYTPLKGGHVTYQYRDAPDGSRIFEGDFDFKDGNMRIKGQFKDDCQVGNWTWYYGLGHTVNITFYDNGCKFECKGLGRTSRSYLKGTIGRIMREPRMITSLEIYDAGIGRFLRMKWDSSGNQSGPWQAKMNKNEPLYTRDEMGGKWYYVKESTGDKEERSDLWGLQTAMDEAEAWAWSELRPCIMRSTFKKNTNNTNKQKTEDITTNIESEVYDVVDFVADFPGGEKAMCQWLAENIEFPSLAIKNGEKGRVVVSFIVEKDGSITDPKIKSSVSPSIDGEALRVIMTMPKWNPAVKNGKTVRTRRQIPITFR